MTEPLSDVKIKDIEEELKINTVCPARFGAYLSSLIISHRLLQQRITELEAERDKYKKEALIKFDCQVCSGALEKENDELRTERDALKQELRAAKAELDDYTF